VLVASSTATTYQKAIADFYCDGVADQVEIQLAINSLPATGGIVMLTAGTFSMNTNSPITLVSNMLFLMNPATIIKLTANVGDNPKILSADTKTNIVIRGGILDGSKALQTVAVGIQAMCIQMLSCTDCWIDQVTTLNPGTSAALSGYGIYLFTCLRTRVTHCLMNGAKRENFCHYWHSTDSVITGNVAMNCDDRNYVFHSSERCLFSNNVSLGATITGIDFTTEGVECIITGNEVSGSGYDGIYVGPASIRNIISNNILRANGRHGIYVQGYDNQVLNNECISNVGAGINLHADSSYNLIASNWCYDNGSGGAGYQNGIHVSGDYNSIVDNKCRKGASQLYGIRIFAGGDNNLISNNDVRDGGATGGLTNAGASNLIRYNAGYITENQGKSTGTGAQQTIAHGCSTTPTHIILSDEDNGSLPYQSAAADATNIYITAVNTKKWQWLASIR
jgi:parallel beta-helix repeat protein